MDRGKNFDLKRSGMKFVNIFILLVPCFIFALFIPFHSNAQDFTARTLGDYGNVGVGVKPSLFI